MTYYCWQVGFPIADTTTSSFRTLVGAHLCYAVHGILELYKGYKASSEIPISGMPASMDNLRENMAKTMVVKMLSLAHTALNLNPELLTPNSQKSR